MDQPSIPRRGSALLDLDLRQLRYFVAVAERLHFGRAAESLYITQPALSRQIRELEEDLGVSLFARTSRDVALTPAGEQLARDAVRLLAASNAAVTRARRAGEGDQAVTVGFMLGTDIEVTIARFSARHPAVEMRVKRVRWWNQAQALLDGSVDVAFVRLPLPAEGLTVVPLYTETVNVALPASHPLGGRPILNMSDLADEPALVYAEAPHAWNAFWTVDPRPDGRRPAPGPVVHDMEEILEYVKAGRGVVFLPRPICDHYPRSDVAYIPVADVPCSHVALAWDETSPSALILDFGEAAREAFSRA